MAQSFLLLFEKISCTLLSMRRRELLLSIFNTGLTYCILSQIPSIFSSRPQKLRLVRTIEFAGSESGAIQDALFSIFDTEAADLFTDSMKLQGQIIHKTVTLTERSFTTEIIFDSEKSYQTYIQRMTNLLGSQAFEDKRFIWKKAQLEKIS